MRTLLIFSLLWATVTLSAQSIGVRAGWNFNRFSGPLEVGESFNYTNGIHFGINYGYKFTKNFMLRTELLYNQKGCEYKFDGKSYYQIYNSEKTVYEVGRRTVKLEISNSYICLPVTAVFQLGSKFEVFGGLSADFLVSPKGRGTLRFESEAYPANIVFRQTLDYRYYSDVALAASTSNTGEAKIIVDGKIVGVPKAVGAYYQTDVKNGSLFNWFGMSAIGGVNYFINRGFYIGGRIEYGLLDLTNNKMDDSVVKLNDDFSLIKRDDKDLQLTYQMSIGFRF